MAKVIAPLSHSFSLVLNSDRRETAINVIAIVFN